MAQRGGQSGPEGRTVRDRSRELAEALVGWRTVRHCISILYQKGCLSGVGFKVELRTVRPWGVDGPPANLRFVPERLFLWFGLKSELRTVRSWGADGPHANSILYQRACLSLVSQIS